MSLSKEEKEIFHKAVFSVPYWVKNADDFLRLVQHLQYRIFQEKRAFCETWKFAESRLRGIDFDELFEIEGQIRKNYDEEYKNLPPNKHTWAEILKWRDLEKE